MITFSAKVLFAKQVARKRKTWQDGFLFSSEDQSKRSATLYDESGVVVSTARLPASQVWSADAEGTVVPNRRASTHLDISDQCMPGRRRLRLRGLDRDCGLSLSSH